MLKERLAYLSAPVACGRLALLGQSFSPLLRGENSRAPCLSCLPRLFGLAPIGAKSNRRGLLL